MMSSVDPIFNKHLIEIDPITGTSKGQLENVKAGDIVITLNAIETIIKCV